jgi:hypothetical protein
VLDPNLMILAQGKKLRELNMAERPKWDPTAIWKSLKILEIVYPAYKIQSEPWGPSVWFFFFFKYMLVIQGVLLWHFHSIYITLCFIPSIIFPPTPFHF